MFSTVNPTSNAPSAAPRVPPTSDWKGIVARYQGADVLRSLFQLISTLALLVATLWVMQWAMGRHTWVIVVLALPAAGLFVRTFIIMHDCAHGSFLPWPKVNDAVGFLTGVLTLTPFYQWRRDHALHHASSGDLDRRGYGDILTLTVSEYLSRTSWGRLRYRVFRSPAFLLGVGPLQMIVLQRLPRKDEKAVKGRQIASVWSTNVAIAGLVTTFILLLGFKSVVFVWLPIFYIAAAAGILLFYLQHQFEDAYWEQHKNWDYAEAAVMGSSYFRLPAVLQWFTGNIGLHHVHHLGPRIPNYRLQKAHDENPLFHAAPVMTMRETWRCFRLTLWDEQQRRLVRFRDVRDRLGSR